MLNNQIRLYVRFLNIVIVLFGAVIFCTEVNSQTTGGAKLYNYSGSLAALDTNLTATADYNPTANPTISTTLPTSPTSPTSLSNYGTTDNALFVAQNNTPAPLDTTGTFPDLTYAANSTTPSAALSQPYSQQFDPYAIIDPLNPTANATNTSTTIAGNSGVYSGTTSNGYFDNFFPETMTTMKKFREATHVAYLLLPRGSKENVKTFGMQELDLRMQFAIPCRFVPDYQNGASSTGSIYIAPGGSLYWWDGPGVTDVNPNGFATYIDVGMKPQITEFFSLESWFRFGAYADFKKINSDALRYQGEIVGNLKISTEFQIIAGAKYWDRQRYKLLPVIGFAWMPRDDWTFYLVFPKPKITKRVWTDGRTTVWAYVQGELGGESWLWQNTGKTDYNDIRFTSGLDFQWNNQINGFVEIGGSFNRELYSQNTKWLEPRSVFYFKLGFDF
ncbi:MAG: hypothetical protein LBQ66_15985 [Planctomycetaceae bacterium]|nr:hypothetical protein [Planctomycetaceae bacterium]